MNVSKLNTDALTQFVERDRVVQGIRGYVVVCDQAYGNHFSTGGQDQKSPVRHKRGIIF